MSNIKFECSSLNLPALNPIILTAAPCLQMQSRTGSGQLPPKPAPWCGTHLLFLLLTPQSEIRDVDSYLRNLTRWTRCCLTAWTGNWGHLSWWPLQEQNAPGALTAWTILSVSSYHPSTSHVQSISEACLTSKTYPESEHLSPPPLSWPWSGLPSSHCLDLKQAGEREVHAPGCRGLWLFWKHPDTMKWQMTGYRERREGGSRGIERSKGRRWASCLGPWWPACA